MKNLELSYLLDFYGDVLTDKQKDMMQQYYNMDLSLSEIAANFGITRQGVRDSIKRGESVLVELEDQIGFARKYRNNLSDVEQIKALSQSIVEHHLGFSMPGDPISESVGKIVALCDSITNG